jgi:hypothetical protein
LFKDNFPASLTNKKDVICGLDWWKKITHCTSGKDPTETCINAERLLDTFINRGKIHRKNIKDEMIEIVAEKIGACQDPFAGHSHAAFQEWLSCYFDDRLTVYGKMLTASYKRFDKR